MLLPERMQKQNISIERDFRAMAQIGLAWDQVLPKMGPMAIRFRTSASPEARVGSWARHRVPWHHHCARGEATIRSTNPSPFLVHEADRARQEHATTSSRIVDTQIHPFRTNPTGLSSAHWQSASVSKCGVFVPFANATTSLAPSPRTMGVRLERRYGR